MEPKAQLSVMFSTQNVSIVNYIMQKLHAMGFSQVQSPLDNQRVAGRISHFATQLEGDNGGSVDPACGTGVSHPFQGRSSPSAPSSTLPVCGRSDEPFTSGSHLVNKRKERW